jgi:hypothetical protein
MSLKIALVTDVHYADVPMRNGRFYRESLGKLQEAARVLAPRRPDLAVCLGDLIDGPEKTDPIAELSHLKTIQAEFQKLAPRRAYVLGNHCVNALTKGTYLRTLGQKKSYFSFDTGGWHLIILDACFRADGAEYAPGKFSWDDADIPAPERAWLAADLSRATLPTVVFCHQRLDMDADAKQGARSSRAVRQILESSGRVKAVFMGHTHTTELRDAGGIRYATLPAMVEGSGPESNGYSLLTLNPGGSFALTGFRRHAEHPLHVAEPGR